MRKREAWLQVGVQLPLRLGFVDKKYARSEIWKYFSYISDSEGKPTDPTRPVCKKCFRSLQTKGANTSNLAKHLRDEQSDVIACIERSPCFLSGKTKDTIYFLSFE